MSHRRKMSNVERYMDKCQHFTGLMNGACKAGVVYETVTLTHEKVVYDPPYSSTRSIPCIPSHNYRGAICPKFVQVTRESAEQREAQVNAEVAKFFGDLAAERCPRCGRESITKKQVGRCVYAVECGHPLYQGWLPGEREKHPELDF